MHCDCDAKNVMKTIKIFHFLWFQNSEHKFTEDIRIWCHKICLVKYLNILKLFPYSRMCFQMSVRYKNLMAVRLIKGKSNKKNIYQGHKINEVRKFYRIFYVDRNEYWLSHTRIHLFPIFTKFQEARKRQPGYRSPFFSPLFLEICRVVFESVLNVCR